MSNILQEDDGWSRKDTNAVKRFMRGLLPGQRYSLVVTTEIEPFLKNEGATILFVGRKVINCTPQGS